MSAKAVIARKAQSTLAQRSIEILIVVVVVVVVVVVRLYWRPSNDTGKIKNSKRFVRTGLVVEVSWVRRCSKKI